MKEMDPFEAIRAELAKLEARPGVAKVAAESLRSQQRCKAHAIFCAGIEHLLLNGWSMRKIADHLDVHPVTLKDWHEQGDRQRSQLPAWVTEALPIEAQPAMIRARLDNVRFRQSGRTGTDG